MARILHPLHMVGLVLSWPFRQLARIPLLRWIGRQSIWAPGAIPLSERKYRNLKRVLLPFVDWMLLNGGLITARRGVPSIDLLFPNEVMDAWSYSLSAVALFALIGVSFPHLWPVEAVAKCLLIGIMLTYLSSMFILTSRGDTNRGLVMVIVVIVIGIISWRLSLIAAEWQDRRTLKRLGGASNV